MSDLEIDYIVWGDISFTDSLAPDAYFSKAVDHCEKDILKQEDEDDDQGLDFLG